MKLNFLVLTLLRKTVSKYSKHKIKFLLFLIAIFSFSLSFTARAYYSTPLRSWIKLYLIAYQPSLTPTQATFEASHFDAFNSIANATNSYPSQAGQSAFGVVKTMTDAPMVMYDNFYCLYVGDAKYTAMATWAAANGVDLESMFIHFSAPTSVTFGGVTHTLAAGSRVPTYYWPPGAWDDAVGLTATNSRVILDVGNPNYRAFNAYYQNQRLNTVYNGYTYDGIWIDNTVPGITGVTQNASASSWPITEYPQTGSSTYNGSSMLNRDIAYANDMVSAFADVKAALASGKQIHANLAYFQWPQLYPYLDVIFREYLFQNTSTNGTVVSELPVIRDADSNNVETVVSVKSDGSTATDKPQIKMNLLTMYYMISSDKTYYEQQRMTGNPASDYQWTPAIEYNVGQPMGEFSLFKAGVDPTSAKRDTGTFNRVTGVGSNVVTLYDENDGKNWSLGSGNGEWQGNKFTDAANNVFTVYHSGANWVSVYINNPATTTAPVTGNYEMGTVPYKVFEREFDNAVILSKPLPDYTVTIMDDTSATTHTLPVTVDNPTGQYYLLNIDGTLAPTPVTQISLNNASGAILIKASKAISPTFSVTNFIGLISNWLHVENGNGSDLNSDGKVNTKDLGIMMSKWN